MAEQATYLLTKNAVRYGRGEHILEQLIGGADKAAPVKDVTTDSFAEEVLAASRDMTIVVDFWAPWCGPCKTLTPALEKIATEFSGRAALVKVNIDENQILAQQMRIQSIPAVVAFRDGRPVDAFMGAVPESEVRAFFERVAGPGGASFDDMLAQADAALADGDLIGAGQIFAEVAKSDSGNARALAGLAQCHLKNGAPDRAHEMLELVPSDRKSEPAVVQALAALALANSADTDSQAEIQSLRAAVAADPTDLNAKFTLAEALIAGQEQGSAVDALLEIIAADREWNDGAARQKLLTLFDALGSNDPITTTGRRRLSSILFA